IMKALKFLILILVFSQGLNAQTNYSKAHFFELGLMAGFSNYSGDLSEGTIELSQSRPVYGAFARYHLSPSLFLKSQFSAGRIYADDKYSETRADRQFRVNGPLMELSTVLEYSPLDFGYENSSGEQFYFFPYLFVGIGGTFVKPELTYYGPPEKEAAYVKTPFPEGGKAQRLLFCAPMGLGLRFNLKSRTTLGLEFGARPAFSDLLDGVSENGNPKAKDWYYFGGITASYYLGQPWEKRNSDLPGK
ncbi:MAG: DUF6089 family protein, partial [Saprospiraceae bacterium]